jgi:hypothetical protein
MAYNIVHSFLGNWIVVIYTMQSSKRIFAASAVTRGKGVQICLAEGLVVQLLGQPIVFIA